MSALELAGSKNFFQLALIWVVAAAGSAGAVAGALVGCSTDGVGGGALPPPPLSSLQAARAGPEHEDEGGRDRRAPHAPCVPSPEVAPENHLAHRRVSFRAVLARCFQVRCQKA